MFSNFPKTSKSISFVLLISCLLLFNNDCYSQSANKWHADTPDTGSDNTWLYVTLGVLAAGALTYFIVKSSSSDDSSAQKNKEPKNIGAKSDSTNSKEPDTTSVKEKNDSDK